MKMGAVLLSLLMLVTSANTIYATEVTKNFNVSDTLNCTISNIQLSVTENGIITRNMNGRVSVFNYNAENFTNISFKKLENWNGSFTALVKDNVTGQQKIMTSGLGNVWVEPDLTMFADSDIVITGNETFNINDFVVYGDQLFVACDNGILIILSPCAKCYKLKKVSDTDIKGINVVGSNIALKANDGTLKYIPINSVRQSNIQVDAALQLLDEGAVFIDVRTVEEFAEKHFDRSTNIPLDKIQQISQFNRNTVIVFYCQMGGRAEKALKYAQQLGFTNVYNLGSVDKLL